ncbi:MAG TPA: hypothetical protein VNH65_14495 [Candidatus Acidoferrum sp.]|nr:hypothetical protein [Candidatus Acidoferrum sp.]
MPIRPRQEPPRIDTSHNHRAHAPELGATKLWRITCFVVLKEYRKRGVASAAPKAALESIRRKGGGLVEAYPITRWKSRPFGNESIHGTVSMFNKQGFKLVAPFAASKFSSSGLIRRII